MGKHKFDNHENNSGKDSLELAELHEDYMMLCMLP